MIATVRTGPFADLRSMWRISNRKKECPPNCHCGASARPATSVMQSTKIAHKIRSGCAVPAQGENLASFAKAPKAIRPCPSSWRKIPRSASARNGMVPRKGLGRYAKKPTDLQSTDGIDVYRSCVPVASTTKNGTRMCSVEETTAFLSHLGGLNAARISEASSERSIIAVSVCSRAACSAC